MADPYPITLTQVDAEDFTDAGEPVPFVVVGPIPGAGGGGVESVNGQTGAVTLTASDVGAREAGNVPWSQISSVPATLTSAAAAGTPSVRAIGTTATTAKAGDYTPAWSEITGVPVALTAAQAAGTPSIRAIGTTATTAKAGDYQPTWAQVTSKPATVVALPATLGTAGQVLAVNTAGTGLEWITPA